MHVSNENKKDLRYIRDVSLGHRPSLGGGIEKGSEAIVTTHTMEVCTSGENFQDVSCQIQLNEAGGHKSQCSFLPARGSDLLGELRFSPYTDRKSDWTHARCFFSGCAEI